MIQPLFAAAVMLLAGPPPLPALGLSPDPVCPAAAAPADGPAAEALLERANALLLADDQPAALETLRQAVSTSGGSSAGLRALRLLISNQPESRLGEIEPFLACVSHGANRLATAWFELRQEDYAAVVRRLYVDVLPRHHSAPRLSAAHETIGDAYAGLGQHAAAQAQWLLALATDYDPHHSFEPEAVRRKLSASMAGEAGAQPYLPLVRYHDALSILDATSVTASEAGVRYSKIVLLHEDEDGAAYGIDTYEIDCKQNRRRVLGVRTFDAEGDLVREGGSGSWLDDRPGEPFLPTERRLVCDLDLTVERVAPANPLPEMLRAYRAFEPVFEASGRP